MDKLAKAEEQRKASGLPLGLAWFVKCLRLYATFEGRARRREFLIFMAWNVAISLLLSLVALSLSTIADLLLFLPGLAVHVRRFHDIGKSGWWVLLPFVGVGAIMGAALAIDAAEVVAAVLAILGFFCVGYSLWLLLSDSRPGANKYGENPKGISQVIS